MTESKKKLVLGSGAAGIFILAGVLLLVRGGAKAEFPRTHKERAVDISTGEEFTIQARNDETAPYANPKTGKRTLYPWYYCEKCQKRVVPLLDKRGDGLAQVPMIPHCPVCNSSVVPWVPEFPEQAHPKGDAPLPKLP